MSEHVWKYLIMSIHVFLIFFLPKVKHSYSEGHLIKGCRLRSWNYTLLWFDLINIWWLLPFYACLYMSVNALTCLIMSIHVSLFPKRKKEVETTSLYTLILLLTADCWHLIHNWTCPSMFIHMYAFLNMSIHVLLSLFTPKTTLWRTNNHLGWKYVTL